MEEQTRHHCFIYDGPPSRQLPLLAGTIHQKLNEGYRCLYLNSRPMVAGIRSCLAALGVDVMQAIAQKHLVLSSEVVTSTDGGFDVAVMLQKLEEALDQALSAGFKGLWATGDMSWEFGSEKNLIKLLEYEHGLEELFLKRPELAGVCQYHKDTLPPEATRQGLSAHRSLFVNETLSRINPHFISSRESGKQPASEAGMDELIRELCQAQS